MPEHPFLIATAEQLRAASVRATDAAGGRKTARELLRAARRGAELDLPEFDHSWYRGATRADWRAIYPQVSRDTTFVPRPLADACLRQAIAWRLGLDDRLLEPARRILMHFVENYQFDIEHWDVGMNYAGWGMSLLGAHDLMFDELAGDDRRALDEFFMRLHAAIDKNDRDWVETNPGGRYNNHYTWHKWAIGCLGLFHERDEWVKYALFGPMGITEVMENAVMDDGFWFESATNYHFTPLYALVPLARALRNAGHEFDLFTHAFVNGRSLRDLFTTPIEMAFPDLTLPVVGDCYGRRTRVPDVPQYAEAAAIYDEPALAWLLTERSDSRTMTLSELLHPPRAIKPQAPGVRSRTWPEHGYAMLREVEGTEYWHSDSWAAFLSADRSSVHANADRLSLNLFGRGKLLAGNAEARAPGHSFSSRVQRELNRTTLAKNTLMVDHSSQRHTPHILRISEFRAGSAERIATIDDDGMLYEGVRQRRTVIVTDGYVLDVYWAASASPREYTWLLHMPLASPTTKLTVPTEPGSSFPDDREFAWLRNLRSAAADGPWHAEWDVEGVCFRASFAGQEGTRVLTADFPRTQDHEPPAIPMLAVARNAPTAAFIVVYQAGVPPLPDASLSVTVSDGSHLDVEVRIGGRIRRHRLTAVAGI